MTKVRSIVYGHSTQSNDVTDASGTLSRQGAQCPAEGTLRVTTSGLKPGDVATFDVTGAANYSGSGPVFEKAHAPVGDYTATFHQVGGYLADTTRRRQQQRVV